MRLARLVCALDSKWSPQHPHAHARVHLFSLRNSLMLSSRRFKLKRHCRRHADAHSARNTVATSSWAANWRTRVHSATRTSSTSAEQTSSSSRGGKHTATTWRKRMDSVGSCSSTLTLKQSRDEHIAHIHGDRERVICPHPGCGKSLADVKTLRRHQATHQGRPRLPCPYADCPQD
ncbi:hypothetical protein BDZ90DRAFT_106756 [Jaminaea rosea]|uniref:C2H2-type domain-containing protein n=1 Tax=Jaminaea rosea TaxID=1569628 RepID=A0A316UVP5_9BASI|nr:hypothetical protein BDZ90DRAFT_106756 [Jaminaea rosea]PWN29366.1 hypothetical protein BDZ90DRAFT_106756 [Jaminaea rosea]